MTTLPQRLPPEMMQVRWAALLNPLLANPITQGLAITGIALVAATPKEIQTNLGRTMQGWFVTDNTADCTVWRSGALSQSTLTLTASANTTISIWVF